MLVAPASTFVFYHNQIGAARKISVEFGVADPLALEAGLCGLPRGARIVLHFRRRHVGGGGVVNDFFVDDRGEAFERRDAVGLAGTEDRPFGANDVVAGGVVGDGDVVAADHVSGRDRTVALETAESEAGGQRGHEQGDKRPLVGVGLHDLTPTTPSPNWPGEQSATF